jgi:hypothetical protein
MQNRKDKLDLEHHAGARKPPDICDHKVLLNATTLHAAGLVGRIQLLRS